eukprot:1817685-Amphidinium_carterae.2
MEFALQDSISGIIGCVLAGFGLQAATPASHRLLPSFIVLSFANGTMQSLLAAESFATLQRLHLAKLTSVKLAAATALASPALIFAGIRESSTQEHRQHGLNQSLRFASSLASLQPTNDFNPKRKM